jgi:flagellar biosynthesis regulator FlbT
MEKVILNIEPMKTKKEAEIMAKVIQDLIKKNKDKEVLINFKQIDGTSNTYGQTETT